MLSLIWMFHCCLCCLGCSLYYFSVGFSGVLLHESYMRHICCSHCDLLYYHCCLGCSLHSLLVKFSGVLLHESYMHHVCCSYWDLLCYCCCLGLIVHGELGLLCIDHYGQLYHCRIHFHYIVVLSFRPKRREGSI